MAIPRKKILERIAGFRQNIESHLDEHIPEILPGANIGLVEYWRKEVSQRIGEFEYWAKRLSKHDTEMAQAADYRQRLSALLDGRLRELED